MPYVVTHTRVLSNDLISHSAEYVAVEAESFHLLPHTARHNSYVIPMYRNEHVLLYTKVL